MVNNILERRTMASCANLFLDHRLLLHNSMKEYIEGYFRNSEGLRELWMDVSSEYRINNSLEGRNPAPEFIEKMKQTEWDIEVVVIGYYAENPTRAERYLSLNDGEKQKVLRKLFNSIEELKRKRLEHKLEFA